MRKEGLDALSRLVQEDERVVFVGSDLGFGVMAEAKERFPDRVLVEGIAEQHLVGFAAGLALEGFVPFVHTIATFLTRRALEQIAVDVALHRLPVKLVGAGGGMVYAPLGPTHQAVDDFALMRAIPGMRIVAPSDSSEMVRALEAEVHHQGPAYFRVGKGDEPKISDSFGEFRAEKIRPIFIGSEVIVLTTGVLVHECFRAVADLRSEGFSIGLVHVPYVSPLDEVGLLSITSQVATVISVEEHLPNGGLSSAITDLVASHRLRPRIHRLTLPGTYASNYGSQREHLENCCLTHHCLASRFREIIAM